MYKFCYKRFADRTKMKMRIKTSVEKMSPNSAVNGAISQPREVNDTPTCERSHLVDCSRRRHPNTSSQYRKSPADGRVFQSFGRCEPPAAAVGFGKTRTVRVRLGCCVEDGRISSIAPVAGIAGDAVGKLPQGWETSFL